MTSTYGLAQLDLRDLVQPSYCPRGPRLRYTLSAHTHSAYFSPLTTPASPFPNTAHVDVKSSKPTLTAHSTAQSWQASLTTRTTYPYATPSQPTRRGIHRHHPSPTQPTPPTPCGFRSSTPLRTCECTPCRGANIPSPLPDPLLSVYAAPHTSPPCRPINWSFLQYSEQGLSLPLPPFTLVAHKKDNQQECLQCLNCKKVKTMRPRHQPAPHHTHET